MTRKQAAWNPADHDYTIPGTITKEDVAWMDEQARLYRLERFDVLHIHGKDQSTALALQLGLQHRCPGLKVSLSWPEPTTVQKLFGRRGWGKTYENTPSEKSPPLPWQNKIFVRQNSRLSQHLKEHGYKPDQIIQVEQEDD